MSYTQEQHELERELERLQDLLGDQNNLAVTSELEEAFNPQFERVSGHFHRDADFIRRRIREVNERLIEITPSDEVLRVFSVDAWHILKQHYTLMNRDTKLKWLDVPESFNSVVVPTGLIHAPKAFAQGAAWFNPPSVSFVTVRLDRWLIGENSEIRFAYSPELNTLFYAGVQ